LLSRGEIHRIAGGVIVLKAAVESKGSARIEVVLLFHSSFVEFVVDVDSRPDQYIQRIDDTTTAHEFVLDIFLEATSEHSHECVIVPFGDKSVLLELDCVFRGRSLLAQVLDDSNRRFLVVGDSKDKSHVFLESVEVGKESVGVSIHRSIFEELVEVGFDLVLSASTQERGGEEGLLLLCHRSEEEVHLDLVEPVLKFLTISIVQIRFLHLGVVPSVAAALVANITSSNAVWCHPEGVQSC